MVGSLLSLLLLRSAGRAVLWLLSWYRLGLGSSRRPRRVQTLASNCPKWDLNSGREPPGADRDLTMDTQGYLRLPRGIESQLGKWQNERDGTAQFTVG